MEIVYAKIHRFIIRERDTDKELTVPQACDIAHDKMIEMGREPGDWDKEAYFHRRLQNTVVVEYAQ